MNPQRITEIEHLLGKRVKTLSPVAGGDINKAYKVDLYGRQSVFVKTQTCPEESMYKREAEGLSLLLEAQALRIPNVLAVSKHLIILEWIETSQRTHNFDEIFGRGLATLHCTGLPTFGLIENNFLGTLPQINQPLPTWHTFYRDRRIFPLAQLAYDHNLLDTRLLKRITTLCNRLDQLCGPEEPIARLHGDLWSGNVISDEIGNPVLIDPAVYGGHREIDLAMLCLFDSDVSSLKFLDAYQEIYPLDSGFKERIALYQLYPLLAHLCMFGQSYLSSLIIVLKNYE